MRLTINLATRGRPERLIRTLERTLPNIVRDDTRLIVSVDEDDTATRLALAGWHGGQRPGVIVSIKPREDTVGAKWNRALTVAPADVYLVMVDYVAQATPGFDQRIVDAASVFPDNIGVVYSHMANASFPSLNAVTHGLAEKMGFIYPEHFPYWFVDHWLDDIARLIDRIAFADVKSEIAEKPLTQNLREPSFWATVFDAGILARRACAHAIIKSDDFLEAAWRKEILLTHHPLIEYRSRWANDILRQNSAKWDQLYGAGPADERYERIKAKAMTLLADWTPALEAEWAKAA